MSANQKLFSSLMPPRNPRATDWLVIVLFGLCVLIAVAGVMGD